MNTMNITAVSAEVIVLADEPGISTALSILGWLSAAAAALSLIIAAALSLIVLVSQV